MLVNKEIITNIIKKEVDDIPPKYSNFANELVKMLLSKNVNTRPSMREILELPELSAIVC